MERCAERTLSNCLKRGLIMLIAIRFIICLLLVLLAYGLMLVTEFNGFDIIPRWAINELSVVIYIISMIISPTVSRQRLIALLYILFYLPILTWASWLDWGKGYDPVKLLINVLLLMLSLLYLWIRSRKHAPN